MTDWQVPPDDEDTELGRPIAELRELDEGPAPGFLRRIRNSINRRRLAGDAVDFGIGAYFQTFFEFLKAALESLGGPPRKREED
jgi:hypothetical protein